MNAPASQPLVSIVTPSYNQAAYLEATINSVLAQDFAPLEYLIVDGASQDGSPQIIQRHTGRLAWWISEADRGQAEAINKGFQHAKGEIVAWLNSDDVYLPGAIQSAVNALQANPQAGMVYGDAITIDPAGRPLNRLAFGDWGLFDLMNFRVVCQPAVFMRRPDTWMPLITLCWITSCGCAWRAWRPSSTSRNYGPPTATTRRRKTWPRRPVSARKHCAWWSGCAASRTWRSAYAPTAGISWAALTG
jgi:glycosyltransferase involved in cell wall biosynthesis